MSGRERLLQTVSLNHAVNDGAMTLISTLFPVLVTQLHLNFFEIGFIVGVGFLVNAVVQPFTGRLSDRLRPHHLLMLGVGLLAAALPLFSLARDFLSLLAIVIFLRLGSSFYHPVGNALVSRLYDGPGIDRAMGFQSSFGNVGIMAVFATGGVLYSTFGWETPFLVWTAVCLVAIGITYLAAKSSPLVDRPATAPDPNHSAAPKKQLAIILFLGAITGAGYALLFNFGNLFAVSRGYDLVRSDWLVAGWMAAATLGALSFARLSGWWGRGRILTLGYGVVTATMLAIVYGGSSGVFVAAFLVNGFSLSLTYPGIYAWLSEHTQGAARGAAFGLLFALQITGQALFSFASGWLAQVFTLEAPYLLMATLAFSALVTLPALRHLPARSVAIPAPLPT